METHGCQSTLASARARTESIAQKQSWLERTSNLLERLISNLSGTIDALSRFHENPHQSIEFTQSVAVYHERLIDMVHGLEEVRQELIDVEKRCQGFRRDVSCHLPAPPRFSSALQC
jgi:hypothetical protein